MHWCLTSILIGEMQHNIAQELFKGKPNKLKGSTKGKAFNLDHCWTEIHNEKKWKNHKYNDIPNKKLHQGDTDDDASSDEEGKRIPTPNLVAKKRPDERKKCNDKLNKRGDNTTKNH